MYFKDFKPKNDVFLAPMAGVTDKAFRILCREWDCGLVYSEMVSSKGLYYGSKRTGLMLDIDDAEAPAVVQIFGSDPEIMGFMAEEISQNEKIAVVDINMGCPAPKIVKNCEGSALMKNPELAEKVIKAVVNKSQKPVTVKIRKGWDESSVNAVEFAKMIEASGAAAVAVHGRTRAQMYEGKADLDIIKAVKQAVSIPVIGNGDVVDEASARHMLDYTGCDALMIGRGALGNPFLFKRIVHYLETGEITEDLTDSEKLEIAMKHVEMMYEFKGQRGMIEMRKHLAWYLKGMRNATTLKNKINSLGEKDEILEIILRYKEELY